MVVRPIADSGWKFSASGCCFFDRLDREEPVKDSRSARGWTVGMSLVFGRMAKGPYPAGKHVAGSDAGKLSDCSGCLSEFLVLRVGLGPSRWCELLEKA